MLTDKDYNELSQDVYRIDSKHPNYDPNIKERSQSLFYLSLLLNKQWIDW